MSEGHLQEAASEYRFERMERCDSTNNVCLQRAADGDPGNIWISTVEQTAGRGSRGREWQSLRGNLFASLLIRNPCEPRYLPQLTFVSAVSAFEAVAAAAPDIFSRLALKWPNDLLLDRRKLGGILLESQTGSGGNVAVIGFGINLTAHPEGARVPAIHLMETGSSIAAEDMLSHLAERFSENRQLWNQGERFEIIRQKWLDSAHGVGTPIEINIPGKEKRVGKFAGIDETGYLILETNTGQTERISAADIFFLSSQ